jgi:hypothetical protein
MATQGRSVGNYGQYKLEEDWDNESQGTEDSEGGYRGGKPPPHLTTTGLIAIGAGVIGMCGALVGLYFLLIDTGGPATTTPSPNWATMVSAPAPAVLNYTTTFPVLATTASDAVLAPAEDLDDGNVCSDDEEALNGLCYYKCSILTNGTHPIRTSAMSCCDARPCGFSNQLVKVGMCAGYDVAGPSTAKNGCPHTPGSCLTNEELSVGNCFKKCSVLTNGTYPYRITAITCCKEKGFQCLEPQNLLPNGIASSSSDYNVGGGEGDGEEVTPGDSHAPIPQMTEE